MSNSCNIRGVPVQFPFEPYEIQKNYMAKVIECLQNESNGVLESPTGTGKTLSLLCSSLAWLSLKKAQVQAQIQSGSFEKQSNNYLNSLQTELSNAVGESSNQGKSFFGLPTIIYASRTHSQLSQAMQELKRTAYSHMKASVLGSRDQLCVHPEVTQETNTALKVNMCRLKVRTRTCNFYNRVDQKKSEPDVANVNVVDIEDLVKMGRKHKFCPYYMSKELLKQADILFMPYNYLLDPLARKSLGITLANNIIILDEAHNIERMCEDSASLQIRTTDVTSAIEEVTQVMKALSSEVPDNFMNSDTPADFSADELCLLKQMLLDFEKAVDDIELKDGPEGTTLEGNYIFEILGKAGVKDNNNQLVISVIERIVQYLSTATEGPFQRKGRGLQLFADLLVITFANTSSEFKDKIGKCFKVHVSVEEQKNKYGSVRTNTWLSKLTAQKTGCRLLSYWCFSPGFGMNMLMKQGVKCVILTSGTLAPLRPLISELELDVKVQLENPHIVNGDQVCVKIIPKGPDMEILNSNFQNRNNPKYIFSLGLTILNLTRIIPRGLLIFFPSYPIMQNCQRIWQEDGTWSSIYNHKPIYVEPKEKEAFNSAMVDYYARVQDQAHRGAIFMGVCRGKVAEGLDFADANGRAVIITGLPYPPLKDPKIILKKRYLDVCHANNKEYLTGDDWYSLEASRAVNQAIGRVIRHGHDYGAILLLDSRFSSPRIKSQMSLWLRNHIKVASNFGEIVREIRSFFRNAEAKLPPPKEKPGKTEYQACPAEFDATHTYKKGDFDFSTSQCCATTSDTVRPPNLGNLHKRQNEPIVSVAKRKKITVVSHNLDAKTSDTENKEYIIMVKKALDPSDFDLFVKAVQVYRDTYNLDEFTAHLDEIFITKPHLRYIILGLNRYIKVVHRDQFDTYWNKMRL